MKITVQTLDKKTTEHEVADDATVLDLKEDVHKVKDHPTELIRLIFTGAILDNNQKKLSDCNIQDGSKVVVLLQKTKPIAQPTTTNQTQQQTETQQTNPEQSKHQEKETNKVTVDDDKEENNDSNPDQEQTKQNNDIQSNPTQNLFNLAAQHANTDNNNAEHGAGGLSGILQQNPQMLMQLLMMMSPQVQQIAQQHPEEFNQLMNDPNLLNNIMHAGQEDELYNKVFEGDVQLTEDQKKEVNEIVEMGFGTYEDAVQYYIALDYNKEATINAILNDQLDHQD